MVMSQGHLQDSESKKPDWFDRVTKTLLVLVAVLGMTQEKAVWFPKSRKPRRPFTCGRSPIAENTNLQNLTNPPTVDALGNLARTPEQFLNDGRQIFVKISYLFQR